PTFGRAQDRGRRNSRFNNRIQRRERRGASSSRSCGNNRREESRRRRCGSRRRQERIILSENCKFLGSIERGIITRCECSRRFFPERYFFFRLSCFRSSTRRQRAPHRLPMRKKQPFRRNSTL